MFLGEQFARFDQVVYPLALVGDLDRTEQDQFSFLWQFAMCTGFFLVVWFEEVGVDRVGNAYDGLVA